MTKFVIETIAVTDGVIEHKLHDTAPVDEQVPNGQTVGLRESKGQKEPAGQIIGEPVLQ